MKSEAEVQRDILDWLNKRPDVFAWRNQSMGIMRDGKWTKKKGFDIKGTSDILGWIAPSGRGLAVEVKREDEDERALTPEQCVFLAKGLRMGAVAFWANSLQMAMDKFKELTNE